MPKEREDVTAERDTQPEKKEETPTSIDLIDKQISIGEEKPQEQNIGIKQQVQEESRATKKKQKRRLTTSYISNISKQVERNGNQINKITMMIQSLVKQGQVKSTSGAGVVQSQFQSIKQIKSQVSRLQKQVALIQKDVQRIRTAPGAKARTRKPSFAITIMPKSKKSKSITSAKARKSK